MNVVVCVKQVPDPNSSGQLDPSTHNLKRDGELVLDPGDEFGVEAGLQLAEKHGGEVTVVSMGPERGVDAVGKALAMGAAKGVLISDASLAGSDALTTANLVKALVAHEAGGYLVLRLADVERLSRDPRARASETAFPEMHSVTAGASTPTQITRAVIAALEAMPDQPASG